MRPGTTSRVSHRPRPWPHVNSTRASVDHHWKEVPLPNNHGKGCHTATGITDCIYQVGGIRPGNCEAGYLGWLPTKFDPGCSNPKFRPVPALAAAYLTRTGRAIEVDAFGYSSHTARRWWRILQHFVPPGSRRVKCRRVSGNSGFPGSTRHYHACQYRWHRRNVLVFTQVRPILRLRTVSAGLGGTIHDLASKGGY